MHNDDSEEEYQKRLKFIEGYQMLRMQMLRVEAELDEYYRLEELFNKKFVFEVLDLVFSFYPERKSKEAVFREHMITLGKKWFETINNLTHHYEQGNTDFYDGLYEPEFEITPSLEDEKELLSIGSAKTKKWMLRKLQTDYAEAFYYQCYCKHIHLLLKKLFPEYIHKIYNLPAQGFMELDGLLYIAMIEVHYIIREFG